MKRITNAQLAEVSPLADVRLEPLYRSGGKEIDKNVVVLDPEGSNLEVGVVSPDYILIGNNFAHQTALDVLTRTGLEFNERRMAFDGKKFRMRWVFPEFQMEPRVGDFVRFGVDTVNSYDGSTRYALRFIAERLQCLNGMVLDFVLGGFSFRHIGGNGDFQEELDTAADKIQALGKNADRILPSLKRMTETEVDLMGTRRIFKALELNDKTAGEALMQIDEPTEWGVFNALTNVTTERNTVLADNLNRDVCQYFMTNR